MPRAGALLDATQQLQDRERVGVGGFGVLEPSRGAGDLDYSDMSRGMRYEVKCEQGRSIDEGAMRGFWRYWEEAVGGGLAVTGDRPASFLEGRNVR